MKLLKFINYSTLFVKYFSLPNFYHHFPIKLSVNHIAKHCIYIWFYELLYFCDFSVIYWDSYWLYLLIMFQFLINSLLKYTKPKFYFNINNKLKCVIQLLIIDTFSIMIDIKFMFTSFIDFFSSEQYNTV